VETTGDITPLEISLASGLVEVVHVVFFPDNIVGADFNFYGPRLTRLGSYFGSKAAAVCSDIQFEPLLRLDVTERLRRLGEIRLFALKVKTSYLDELMDADRDLFRALKAAQRISKASEMEIVLGAKPRSHEWLDRATLGVANRLSRRANLRQEARKFVVKGFNRDTGEIDEIDVLSDELITTKRISRLRPRTRALDPESAYSAIELARRELGQDLNRAASVRG